MDSYLDKKRKSTKAVSGQLYKDIIEMRRLDTHIKEFSKTVDKDLEENDSEVFKHVDKFESEIHKEIDKLFKITREDLDLYLNILRSLDEYKKKIYEKTGSNKFGLTKIEDSYAKNIIRSINDKLDSLKNIFKELK